MTSSERTTINVYMNRGWVYDESGAHVQSDAEMDRDALTVAVMERLAPAMKAAEAAERRRRAGNPHPDYGKHVPEMGASVRPTTPYERFRLWFRRVTAWGR